MAYLTINEAEQVYGVIDIASIRGRRVVGAVLVAHMGNDQIVIDLDLHNKMLVDALKARGILESQIVLGYGGEMQLA